MEWNKVKRNALLPSFPPSKHTIHTRLRAPYTQPPLHSTNTQTHTHLHAAFTHAHFLSSKIMYTHRNIIRGLVWTRTVIEGSQPSTLGKSPGHVRVIFTASTSAAAFFVVSSPYRLYHMLPITVCANIGVGGAVVEGNFLTR